MRDYLNPFTGQLISHQKKTKKKLVNIYYSFRNLYLILFCKQEYQINSYNCHKEKMVN